MVWAHYFRKAKKAVEYFSQPYLCYRYKGDKAQNPAEFLIAISDARVFSYTGKGEEIHQSSRELSQIYEGSDAQRVNQDVQEKYLESAKSDVDQQSRERIPLVQQFILLI